MSGTDITQIVVKIKSEGGAETEKIITSIGNSGEKAEKQLDGLSAGTKRVSTSSDSAVSSLQKYVDKLTNQVNLLGRSTEFTAQYTAALKGGDLAQVALAGSLGREIDAFKDSQKAIKDAEKALNDFNKAAKEAAQNNSLEQKVKAANAVWAASIDTSEKLHAARVKERSDAAEAIERTNDLTNTVSKAGTAEVAFANHLANRASVTKAAAKETATYSAGQIHLIEQIQEAAAAHGKSGVELLKHKAALMGVTDAVAPHIAAMEKAAHGATEFSLASATAKRELVVLIREFARGDFTRMAGSFSIFAQASGLAAVGVTAMGAAVLGAVAVVGVVGFATLRAAKEMQEFANALILSGNAAGATAESLEQIAEKSSAGSSSVSEMREAIVLLAGSGKYSAEQIGAISHSAVMLEEVAGIAVKDTIKQFDSLAVDSSAASSRMNDHISKNLVKLNESTHAFTLETYNSVHALEKQGDQAGASAVAISAYSDELDKRAAQIAKNLTGIQKLWQGITLAANDAIDAIAIGNKTSQRKVVAEDIKNIGALKTRADWGINTTKELAAARAKLAVDTAELNKQELAESVASSGLRAKTLVETKAINAASAIDEHLTRSRAKAVGALATEMEKYTGELADIAAKNPKDDRLAEKAQAEYRAMLTKEFSEHKKKEREIGMSAANADIAEINRVADEAKLALERRTKDNKFYFDSGKIQEGSYYAFQKQIIAETATSEDNRYRKEIERMEKMRPRDTTEANEVAKRISDLTNSRTRAAETYKGLLIDQSHEEELSRMKETDGSNKYLTTLYEETEAEIALSENKNVSKKAMEAFTQAQIDSAVASSANTLSTYADILADAELVGSKEAITKATEDYNAILDQTIYLENIQKEKSKFDTAKNKITGDAAALSAAKQLTKELDQQAVSAKKLETVLTKAFGSIGKAIGGVGVALTEYGKNSDQISRNRQEDIKNETAALGVNATDEQKAAIIKKNNDIASFENSKNMLTSLGALTSASAGFFRENSKGHQAMMAASKVAHAAEVSLSLIKGINAVLTQGSGDPYSAFARMAAMAAIVVGLGVAISGGGGNGSGMSAAEVQKTQGTGTVFGDVTAKSDSINKSMELLSKNSDMMLPLTSQMASSLRNMESGMAGLANIVLRTAGITDGLSMDIKTGTSQSSSNIFGLNSGSGATGLSKILSGLSGLFGKTSSSVTDSGLQFGGSVGALQNGVGFNQYANVDTTKSSWFGLSKSTSHNLQTQGVSDEISQQFGLVFKNLQTVLVSASGALSKDGVKVGEAIQNFVIDTTKLSFKDLKGDELQKAINAVLSGAMDSVAQAVFPELDAFRNVGEGYAQTVVRVASGIEVAKNALDKFNITAIDYTEIINKQGDVSAEIVRQSITAVEKLQDGALTGVGKIIDSLSGAATDLASTYKSLLDVRQAMKAVGFTQDLGVSAIKGAGSVSDLNSGLATYLDKYFTASEKAAIMTQKVSDSFSALGQVLPSSRDAYKLLVSSAASDTSEAGQKLFGSLITLSGAFDTMITSVDALTTVVTSDVKGNLDSWYNTVDAYAAQKTAITDLLKAALPLDAQRELEMQGMTEAGIALQKRIYALQDEASNLVKVNDIAAKKRALDIQLMDLTGNKVGALAATRNDELNALDSSLWATQRAIYAAQDLATANTDAATAETARQSVISSAKSALTSAYQAESSALQSTITKFGAFSDSLKKFRDSLLIGDLSTLSPKQKYEQTKKLFDTTSALAATGDEKALGDLQNVSQEFLTASKGYNASTEAYVKDFNAVQNALTKGISAADEQLAIAQASLTVLNAQLSGLVDINKSVMSVADALAAYLAALSNKPETVVNVPSGSNSAAGSSANPVSNEQMIYDSVQQMSAYRLSNFINKGIGSASDYFSEVTSGVSDPSIINAVRAGLQLDGSHAGGLHSVPFDGYVAELHKGERVVTAQNAKASDDNSAELVNLTREVLAKMSAVEAHTGASNVQRGAVAEITGKQLATLADKLDSNKRVIRQGAAV